jgi:hypothetical protein
VTNAESLTVVVNASNDEGDLETTYGYGRDVDEAVEDALRFLREATLDDSWTMDEWRAA